MSKIDPPKLPLPPTAEALFRFQVISDVLSRVLRGEVRADAIQAAAGQVFVAGDHKARSVGVRTIYRWLNAYENRDLTKLEPASRKRTQTSVVLRQKLLDFVAEQKRDDIAASLPEILRRAREIGIIGVTEDIDRSTLYRACVRMGVPVVRRAKARVRDSRRFAYPHRMQMILCDGKHFRAGTTRAKRVAMFFLDDTSRLGLHVVVGTAEGKQLFLRGLFEMIQHHGIAEIAYLDHGVGYTANDTLAVMAKLPTLLIHGEVGYFAAYSCIESWFAGGGRDPQLVADDMYRFLKRYVHVIWYEVDPDADSIALFTRLNIGRIPLTNSELVKALFLARPVDNQGQAHKNEDYLRQVEIATQWDSIERDLHNPRYWAFLTNEPAADYPTRIELIFDLMADKKSKSKERFQTFFYFKDRLNNPAEQQAVWRDILRYSLLLKEWYENSELYHRVGFLVHDGEDLAKLEEESREPTKRQFIAHLDARITKRLNMSRADVEGLEYGTNDDKIQKLLLLVNVETVRRLKNSTERFAFDAHKQQKAWTLEHIHAQNAEGLNKKEQWQQWLSDHRIALTSMVTDAADSEKVSEKARLVAEIDRKIEAIDKDTFEPLARKISAILSSGDGSDDMHGIANLALLSGGTNSALSNSVFEVKRRKIIELDRDGQYIPICTRKVFLKYYTDADAQQLHFWSSRDREGYLKEIISAVEKYLK